MRRGRGDEAVATVIGAIVLLAVLGTALVYVNAYHVPRQGAALESQGAERTEEALLRLATTLAASPKSPFVQDVPLQTPRGNPPLLSGIVLSPARATGTAALNATSPVVRISADLDAPPGGVPVGDPNREDIGGGRMRIHLLGNRTAGTQVGSLQANVGGAYTATTEYRLEAGMVLVDAGASSGAVSPPSLAVQRGTHTSVAWRIPLLAGTSGEIAGAGTVQVGLRPGPESELSGGRAYRVHIEVNTTQLAAWRSALEDVVGSNGIVNATTTGPDTGTLDVVLLPPPGTPDTVRAVEPRLGIVRYQVALGERNG